MEHTNTHTHARLSRLKVKIQTKNTMPLHVRFHIHFFRRFRLFLPFASNGARAPHGKFRRTIFHCSLECISVIWIVCFLFFAVLFSFDFHVSVLCSLSLAAPRQKLLAAMICTKPITWRRYSFLYYYHCSVRSEGCLSFLSSFGIRETK